MTLGDYLDDRGFGRGVPRPLPRPDHGRGLVDGAGPDARLPGRLPAPLPRQPRPHRLSAAALPWRTMTRRLADLRRPDHRDAPGRDRSGPATRSSAVTRDAVGRDRPDRGRRRTSGSTPSSWRPTPTTRCALLRDADPAERDGARRRSSTPRTRSSSTPTQRLLPRAPRRVVVVERRARPTATPPGDALTMTYHMNRLQALPGADAVLRRRSIPVTCVRDEHVIVERDVQPPAVHVPNARRAGGDRRGSRATATPGTPARTWATASTRTAAAPGSRSRAHGSAPPRDVERAA